MPRIKHICNIALRATFCFVAVVLALATAGCEFNPGKVDRIIHAADAVPRPLPTTNGPVMGVASSGGQAFLGIPYAAPPVGSLRWHAPRSPMAWTAPRPADELGESCVQNLSLAAQTGQGGSGPFLGAEDCLTLNVYAPADAVAGQQRPVMVWIHGGAFVLGTSGQYDPSLLAARTGTVIVTFNYRLGALGFLAHPALRGTAGEGDFALLDQQAALRWVRDNISGVGGDPRNVTLFGQSAGAWSACAQMASPGAAGLFARVILESGACTTPETSIALAEAEAGGTRMAADLGCDVADAMACLMDKPVNDILSAAPRRPGVVGPNSWAPAYGADVLPMAPKPAFESGHYNRVPVIDGTNRDEGRLFTYLRGYQGDLWTLENYHRAVASLFGARAQGILAEYPADGLTSPGEAYGAVLTDSLFACAARSLDRILSKTTPVHAYEFNDPHAPFNLPAVPWSDKMGSFHTAEVAYVFGTPWILADPSGFDAAQQAVSDEIQADWTRFARSGDPNGAVAGVPLAWPRFVTNGPVLELGPESGGIVEDFDRRHRCAFWNALGY